MSPEAERFVSNWQRIHKDTSRVLRAASDDKLDFRPKEDMFSLRQLICHIPQAEEVLVRSALAGSTQKSSIDLAGRSVSEIADLFDSEHDRLVAEVSNLTSEKWVDDVEFHDNRLRRGVLLWFMTEHEIQHRGQVFTYYHLADITPPKLH